MIPEPLLFLITEESYSVFDLLKNSTLFYFNDIEEFYD